MVMAVLLDEAVPVMVGSFQPLHHNDHCFTSNIYLECFGATL